jgi:hypothetical protein
MNPIGHGGWLLADSLASAYLVPQLPAFLVGSFFTRFLQILE